MARNSATLTMINLVIVLPDWNWYRMSLTIELNTVSNVGLIVQNEYTLIKVGRNGRRAEEAEKA